MSKTIRGDLAASAKSRISCTVSTVTLSSRMFCLCSSRTGKASSGSFLYELSVTGLLLVMWLVTWCAVAPFTLEKRSLSRTLTAIYQPLLLVSFCVKLLEVVFTFFNTFFNWNTQLWHIWQVHDDDDNIYIILDI